MRLIDGPWSKTFDAGWPPVVAVVIAAAYAVPRYYNGAGEATALGIAAVAGIAMAIVILLICNAVDDNVSERVENSGHISAVSAVYAAMTAAFLGVCVSGPIVLAVACAILFAFAMLAIYLGMQKDIDESEWRWGWRKLLLSLALIVGYAVLQYTGSWVFASSALYGILVMQFLWTMRLWVRPARVPA